MTQPFNAFIFDLDGVITDTAIYHYRAWKRTAESLGIAFDETDNESLKGVGRRESLEWILAKGQKTLPEAEIERLMAEKNAHYQTLIEDITAADIFPGVEALLQELKRRSIVIALASASKNARTILERLGLCDAFDYIADAASVAHSKPAPDIFLLAAKGLSVPPASAVGIEDAAAGIRSIHAAGMIAVGIGDAQQLHEAELCFPDMQAFDLDQVLALNAPQPVS